MAHHGLELMVGVSEATDCPVDEQVALTRGTELTKESTSKDQQKIGQKSAKKRPLDQFKFTLGEEVSGIL